MLASTKSTAFPTDSPVSLWSYSLKFRKFSMCREQKQYMATFNTEKAVFFFWKSQWICRYSQLDDVFLCLNHHVEQDVMRSTVHIFQFLLILVDMVVSSTVNPLRFGGAVLVSSSQLTSLYMKCMFQDESSIWIKYLIFCLPWSFHNFLLLQLVEKYSWAAEFKVKTA